MKYWLVHLTLGVTLLLFFAVSVFAQGSEVITAQLSGTVLDSSNSGVPGATVLISSTETGFHRETIASQTGQYRLVAIPPGKYMLRVEKEGFSAAVVASIVLTLGQSSALDFTLQVGGLAQSIEVKGDPPVINTGNADMGSNVTEGQVKELPLNFRNVYELVNLDSSVQYAPIQQAWGTSTLVSTLDQQANAFNFGGSRWNDTAYLLDGHWNSGGDWGAIQYAPTVDELQEFVIQTNTFSPQYGWTPGNVVNAITKSGTGNFHGGLFEFVRNAEFDANNFFNNKRGIPRTVYQRNQFGANFGGPLYIPGLYKQRNKTFVFGSWDALRQGIPSTYVSSVPTDEMRQGNFSHVFNADGSLAVIYNPFTTRQVNGQFVRDPFPRNIIPSNMMDKVAVNAAKYWPSPNAPGDPLTGQLNFVGAASFPARTDAYTIRVDHNVTDSQRLFARWSQKFQGNIRQGSFFGADNPAGMGQDSPSNRFDGGIGYTWVATPTLVIQLNAGFNRWAEEYIGQNAGFSPSKLGLPAFLDTGYGATAFPYLGVAGLQTLGASGGISNTPRESRSYALDVTKIQGAHTLTAGFMMIDFRLTSQHTSQPWFSFPTSFTQGPDPLAADPNTGIGFASFLLGTANAGGDSYTASPAFNKNMLGWYFNDSWKASRNLTVNLGLRYDFQTAPTDRFDRLSYITFDRNPISDKVGMDLKGILNYTGGSNPRTPYDPSYRNFAPRISIAYSPSSKLVVRSGFGLFYSSEIQFGDYQGLPLTGFSQSTPFLGTIDGVTPKDLLSNPFPGGLLPPTGKQDGVLTNLGQDITAPLRGRASPYVEQWTASLQYQAPGNTVLQAAYVGNHGVKLPFENFSLNQLSPQYLAMGDALLNMVPNPFFGIITSGPLSQPTVTQGQLLRPFPQYTSVTSTQPPGASSSYNALIMSANRRFANGLHFLVSFTASKYLTNDEGNNSWSTGSIAGLRNWYDASLEKSVAAADTPRSLVMSYIYELPVGKGKKFNTQNRVLNTAVGGWQMSGVTTFKDGNPLGFWAADNTNSYGAGVQKPNLLGDPHLAHPTLDAWFNTAAFAQPAPFTFGNLSRTTPYLRAQGINNFDASLQKNWHLWSESSRLEFRAEAYNLFNRTWFYAPDTGFGDRTFSQITQSMPARSLQFGLKLYW